MNKNEIEICEMANSLFSFTIVLTFLLPGSIASFPPKTQAAKDVSQCFLMFLRVLPEAGRNAAEKCRFERTTDSGKFQHTSSQVVRYHNVHNGKQYHQNIFQIHYRDF